MNRPCEIDNCAYYARPNRRTCNQHRHIPADKIEPFVDEVEVDYVIREGLDARGMERDEQKLVAAGLAARQIPDTEIARRIGVSRRTVWRWIADTERPAA